MIIFGAILQIVGFLLCLTIIGAVVGVPLLILGGILMAVGVFGRRKTVITNVITVQHSDSPQLGGPKDTIAEKVATPVASGVEATTSFKQ